MQWITNCFKSAQLFQCIRKLFTLTSNDFNDKGLNSLVLLSAKVGSFSLSSSDSWSVITSRIETGARLLFSFPGHHVSLLASFDDA